MSNQYINEPKTSGKVLLHTTAGPIEIELWAKETPKTCRNFVQLCMEGYYKGCEFHRLVKNFIIQGGDPTGTGKGGESIYGGTFKDEFHQRLRFTRRGLVGMANAGKDDNGSQFFFTIGDRAPAELDKKHTLFGKVTGPTLFNMLKMTETDVGENDRPLISHKITGAEIITNPFTDIVPREKASKKKKEEKKAKKVVETKKTSLLSFGDEAEEDEEELVQFNKKVNKGKSAHDVLDDERLSKEVAVKVNTKGKEDEVEEAERDSSSVSKIREKLMKQLKRKANGDEEEPRDDDFEGALDSAKKQREAEEMEKMKTELAEMQKKYIKELRPKKVKKKIEKEKSDAMKMYSDLKNSFSSKSVGIVSRKDPSREAQTMLMLDKFKAKLNASSQNAILFDKKVEVDPEKKFGMDLDAEDMVGTDWMSHKFHAEDAPSTSTAKDANMKDESEDWYEITDPRNMINRRRRGDV